MSDLEQLTANTAEQRASQSSKAWEDQITDHGAATRSQERAHVLITRLLLMLMPPSALPTPTS